MLSGPAAYDSHWLLVGALFRQHSGGLKTRAAFLWVSTGTQASEPASIPKTISL